MIDFYFGKPRTGKSYRAVKHIYDLYINNKDEPKYRNVLTNIGGFKFDLINQMFLDKGSTSKAYKLVWKTFYSHLKKMYEMALDEKSDEELNKYADYHFINDCLIVLDEASLYMKKYDDVISWWLAYHGHFRIKIIIITQSPKQINSEYMTHTEIFYDAQPQAKQLRSDQLRYIHHSDVPFNKDSKFSSDTIKTSQDIYNLYKSGEVDKPKKIIYKYIAIMLVALLAIFLLINLLFSNMSNRNGINKDIEKSEISNIEPLNDNLSQSNSNASLLLNIRCNERFCWNIDKKYEPFEISLNYFKTLVIKYQLKLEYSEISNEIYSLKSFENTLSKVTFAKLTDYLYFIPNDLKDTFLSKLFILRKEDKKSIPLLAENSYFSSESEANED